MPSIAIQDARALYTNAIIDVLNKRLKAPSFLGTFFPEKLSLTKEISIHTVRNREKIAVDVERGTEGRRNKFDKYTATDIVPPFYNEWFDMTDLSLYDRLFGQADGEIDAKMFRALVDQAVEKTEALCDKIDRAYEKQRADVLLTGVIAIATGAAINYNRQADSMIDKGGGNYWLTDTVNPINDLEVGANWVREQGKIQGEIINIIFGKTAWMHFKGNAIVQKTADIKNMSLADITGPQKQANGGTLHGKCSVGSYTALLWTYPEVYDNASNVPTSYIDPKKVIVLPETPDFKTAYGAVPQLIEGGMIPQQGRFLIGEYLDRRKASHVIDVKSAGVAVPTGVDQIHTTKVVA